MAIKFQYNKTSLNEIGKQLKMRQNALPTLKNKESALRLEVRRAKDYSEKLIEDLEAALNKYDYLAALWNEFEPGLISIGIESEVYKEKSRILDFQRKKTTQKVNLYEKVQIPGYQEAIRKIKRYMEDEENLSKAASKIVKQRHAAEEDAEDGN